MEPSVPAARTVGAVDVPGPVGRIEGIWSDPGAGLSLCRGQSLPNLGSETFRDVPRPMIILERIIS